jgi:hypothetical protein
LNQNPNTEKPRRKSSALATVLSLLLSGLGQIYCLQDNKGVYLAGVSLLGHWTTGGISSLLLFPVMSLDALMIARKINQGAPVRRWEFFPGIRPLNNLPPRILPLAVLALIAAITVARIVIYASDYRPGER